ncbi:cupin-like domain-containing protein [Wenyingzhuangia sp. chi5]|uniref:Cupin-like domain-containing protein n=1 Tax=Wenyingzhuangia gilva TaxID=3057677 RepID=A0ABT8VNH1_9FLAO|nr:cupin-like domain-containing protein [Wenyingzhuangia sp. chi5]MDO3693504.1 cupin-like domain-containing protein [Wenyingzhuangia sp. chi5]
MKLEEIDVLSEMSKEEFIQNYFKPQKPVIVKNYSKDWPAFNKWSLAYMKEIAGDKIVPLYDDRPVDPKVKFNSPHAKMKMSDYIDLLKKEPTKFRIFLWNILKEIPVLQNDFKYPDVGLTFIKSLPTLFFGGYDSYTFMHYDIDLANIFHFHFEGKKQCILFDQQQNKYMYKVPNSLMTLREIDFSNPDLEKFPALKNASGYIANLEHGDMLYIPEGYWHYMRYITPGFSMSLRTIAKKPSHVAKAVYNIVVMRNVENLMRKTLGEKWMNWKYQKAKKDTERLNNIT